MAFEVCREPGCPQLVKKQPCWCREHNERCLDYGCDNPAHACEEPFHFCEAHALMTRTERRADVIRLGGEPRPPRRASRAKSRSGNRAG
jgi:hypothetical protein